MKAITGHARGSNRVDRAGQRSAAALRVCLVIGAQIIAGVAMGRAAMSQSPQGNPSWERVGDPVPGGSGITVEPDASQLNGETVVSVSDDDQTFEHVIGDDAGSALAGIGNACCPRWTGQIDALMLFMGNVPSQTFYVNQSTQQPVLNMNDAIGAMSAGPRYAVTWHRDACRALEINYFQVGSFPGAAAVTAPPGTTLASQTLGGVPFFFSDVVSAELQTSAEIKSWEFNLRRGMGGPITWIAGFRWVEWNQSMVITDEFFDSETGTSGTDYYATTTGNNLYGGQLGADMMLWNRGNRFRVNGLAKAGVYYNHQAYQRATVISDSIGIGNDSVTASDDTASFVGELAVIGEYRLTNWLSWRAGYTLFWLGGVAVPANQVELSDFTSLPPTASVSPYSSALLHGVTTGLEARW
jgi:hypothetical protein